MRFRIPTITLAIVLAFCAVNICSYLTMHRPFADAMAYFGWPFNMYGEGGFTGAKRVFWDGLFGNVVVALFVVSVADLVHAAIKIFGSPNLK